MVDRKIIPAALPVDIERGKFGLFYLKSSVVPGLFISGTTEEEAVGQVNDALAGLASAKREKEDG